MCIVFITTKHLEEIKDNITAIKSHMYQFANMESHKSKLESPQTLCHTGTIENGSFNISKLESPQTTAETEENMLEEYKPI